MYIKGVANALEKLAQTHVHVKNPSGKTLDKTEMDNRFRILIEDGGAKAFSFMQRIEPELYAAMQSHLRLCAASWEKKNAKGDFLN